MQNKKVQFIDWGLVDYQDAWNRQEDIFAKTLALKQENRTLDQQNPTPNYLIFTEHPHVYTLGKSGHEEYLLLDEEGLKEKEATFYKINRGGDITYHGPGQIVGYPILDLDNFFYGYPPLPTYLGRSYHSGLCRLWHCCGPLRWLYRCLD